MSMSASQIYGISLACIMMLADIVSGYLQALYNHDFKSSKMRVGLIHKFCTLCILLLGWVIEEFTTLMDVGIDIPTCVTMCVYVVLMEFGSIMENIGKINPDVNKLPFARHDGKDNGDDA